MRGLLTANLKVLGTYPNDNEELIIAKRGYRTQRSFGSVVEHCVSSAKGCGFNSQGTHILTKNV